MMRGFYKICERFIYSKGIATNTALRFSTRTTPRRGVQRNVMSFFHARRAKAKWSGGKADEGTGEREREGERGYTTTTYVGRRFHLIRH